MKLLIGIIVALFAAVGIAIWVREDPGYVLINIGQWTIETSVVALFIILAVGFFLLYKLVRYLTRLRSMPRYLRTASQQRRLRRSRRLFLKGQRELAQGRWEKAETDLLKGAEYSEAPALHYIGAARAAQQLNAGWRRDQYLQKADELPQKDTLVLGLAKAELYLENHESAKAKTTLLELRTLYPRHAQVLKLLMECYRQLGEWELLRDLLPELRKRKALNEKDYNVLQVEIYQQILAKTARTGTLEDLRGLWKQIPKSLRQEEPLLIDYAGYLQENDAASEAEALLRDALNRQWSENLVVGYGKIERGDAAAQLAAAERWLDEHKDNPYLLLTLGRLAKRSRKWDKARSYLEQNIKALPTPDAYQELGEVLEQMDEKERANECYRTGLRLLSKRPPAKEVEVLPAPKTEQVQPSSEEKEPKAAS